MNVHLKYSIRWTAWVGTAQLKLNRGEEHHRTKSEKTSSETIQLWKPHLLPYSINEGVERCPFRLRVGLFKYSGEKSECEEIQQSVSICTTRKRIHSCLHPDSKLLKTFSASASLIHSLVAFNTISDRQNRTRTRGASLDWPKIGNEDLQRLSSLHNLELLGWLKYMCMWEHLHCQCWHSSWSKLVGRACPFQSTFMSWFDQCLN
jgi:hypothetical protein